MFSTERPKQTSTRTNEALLTLKQAAERLAVSERSVWGKTAPRGPIACVKIGRAVRYRATDLDSFVASHAIRPSGFSSSSKGRGGEE